MHDKKYLIKVYKQGQFAGVLPYPLDDYQYTYDINTPGTQITVKLGSDLKGAGIGVDVDYLVTQTGSHLTDQNGNRIITRQDYVFNTLPVDLGNGIDIWVYYSGNANAGQRIFSGVISAWEEDNSDGTITMTALSWGVQLDNYPVEVAPGTDIVSFISQNSSDALFAKVSGQPASGRIQQIAQTFQVASTNSVKSLSVYLSNGGTNTITAYMRLNQGSPTGAFTTLTSAFRGVPGGSGSGRYTFSFPEAVTLTATTTYFWELYIFAGVDDALGVARDSTGGYSSGQGYVYTDTTRAYNTATGDYTFAVQTTSGSLVRQYNSYDPGAIIVSLLDGFTNAGGIVDCDATSVDATGTTVSYTFKDTTMLDAIKKCLELAPPNWYWYVDIGSNTLHFHQIKLTPDHTFILKQHINALKVKYSLETIKNREIFTGGDDPGNPGTNIVSKKSNTTSINKYGQWLVFDSDSRVTTQSTADLITSNNLGQYSQPQFSTSCTVLATRYDIETINMGDMVAFENANDLTNSLILQVVSMTKTPDKADLILATLPPVQAHRIEDIKRNLDAVVTANNPTS